MRRMLAYAIFLQGRFKKQGINGYFRKNPDKGRGVFVFKQCIQIYCVMYDLFRRDFPATGNSSFRFCRRLFRYYFFTRICSSFKASRLNMLFISSSIGASQKRISMIHLFLISVNECRCRH